MLGLSPLGALHTAIGLVAVCAGFLALFKHREISPRARVGRVYVFTTVLTCLTGFGLFRHGAFGKPHALGVLTLVVLALAAAAGSPRWFGRAAPYVRTVAYSATLFFHLIPGFTETLTRVPAGAPVFADQEAPGLQVLVGISFVVFLLGAAAQVRRLRAQSTRQEHGAPSTQPGRS